MKCQTWQEVDDGLQSLADTAQYLMLFTSQQLQFYAPKSCPLYQTHFKESVPIHCAYKVSQTYDVVYIIFFSSTFLYMKGLTCKEYTEVLYLCDCVRNGCLHISVQTISINIWTLIPQNILPLKCWRDFSCHFPQWVMYWPCLHFWHTVLYICFLFMYLINWTCWESNAPPAFVFLFSCAWGL